MQLDEGHFQTEEDAANKEFLDTFKSTDAPFTEGVAPATSTDGEPTPDSDDGNVEDFKYDDALAQEDQQELDELNAKLGSDFKTLNELKATYKSTDDKGQEATIGKEKRYIGYFKDLLDENKYSQEQLIRENKRVSAINNDQDPNSQEVEDRIDEEIAVLRDNGTLEYAAQAIRTELRISLKEKEEVVNSFESGQQLTAKEKADAFKQDLQEGLNDIFKQGKFLGVKPTKDDMIGIYKDISKNKHIEHLKANPKDAVEFALFKKYRDVIMKNLSKPNFNAGVQNTLNELGMSSSESGKSGGDTSNNSDSDELSFLQRFAK